jgi:hypothetical protein
MKHVRSQKKCHHNHEWTMMVMSMDAKDNSTRKHIRHFFQIFYQISQRRIDSYTFNHEPDEMMNRMNQLMMMMMMRRRR